MPTLCETPGAMEILGQAHHTMRPGCLTQGVAASTWLVVWRYRGLISAALTMATLDQRLRLEAGKRKPGRELAHSAGRLRQSYPAAVPHARAGPVSHSQSAVRLMAPTILFRVGAELGQPQRRPVSTNWTVGRSARQLTRPISGSIVGCMVGISTR
jgi:hypothetical protein